MLRDHRRICGPSFTETSLCGAYLYMYQVAWLNSLSHEVHKEMDNISLKEIDVIYNPATCTMIVV
jgi:hypothetical protein